MATEAVTMVLLSVNTCLHVARGLTPRKGKDWVSCLVRAGGRVQVSFSEGLMEGMGAPELLLRRWKRDLTIGDSPEAGASRSLQGREPVNSVLFRPV